jgi:hypothetical protein
MADIYMRAHRHFVRLQKRMQNARAGQFHQRDHARRSEDRWKIIARIVAQF